MTGSVFVGRVVSNRMQKTVVVAVDYVVWRPKLKVYQKRTAKHFAHDEEQACDIGDTVRIRWIPRRSKHKHYTVEEVLRKVDVYSPGLGAAQAALATQQQQAASTQAEHAEAQLRHANQRLKQLQELRDAFEQGAAAAAVAAGGSSSSGGSSESSSSQHAPASDPLS